MKSKYLFVSPHPDDSEYGCGGTISRLVQEGQTVHIVIMAGPGDLEMYKTKEVVSFETRTEEQTKAAKCLGLTENDISYLWAASAGKFDQASIGNTISELTRLIHTYNPDCIFGPSPDYNQDHRHTWDALMAALRPSIPAVITLYAYEIPHSYHADGQYDLRGGVVYSAFDKGALDAKIEAVKVHKSQVKGSSGITSIDGIKALATLRGLESGLGEYAEQFRLIRGYF